MHQAVCRPSAEGTAEASAVQEDRGGYSSASSGAFQEECKGALGGPGGGDGALNQNALLCAAYLLPQLAQVA